MGEEAKKFRDRARQCRSLANDARSDQDRETLRQMANDLEAEAAKIDAEEEGKAEQD